MILLARFFEDYFLPPRVAVSSLQIANYARTIRKYSDYLGYQARMRDLNESSIGKYLSSLLKVRSARTVNNHRQMLLTLWIDAFDCKATENMVEQPRPRRIKKLREEHDPPRCWRKKEMRRLCEYIQNIPGVIWTARASDWWLSMILVIHWTSSRIGSILDVKVSDFVGVGITIRRQKNHKPQWYPLPKSCRQVLRRYLSGVKSGTMWPTPFCRRELFSRFRKIVEAAGLESPKCGRNLFHRLRRTTITYCAVADPSIAQRIAGHQDYTTTQRSYIDPRVVRLPSAADVLFDPMKKKQSRFRIVG